MRPNFGYLFVASFVRSVCVRKKLFGIAFVAGMAVMAVEMTATRLLAPFFGASLFVWTSVIATVLVALASGYEAGGRLADRTPRDLLFKTILRTIFGAGILIVLIPMALPTVVGAIRIWGHGSGLWSVLIPSLLVAIVLFAGPIFLMGMVTPLCARAAVTDASHVGQPVGRLFFVSTLGSFLGTFLPVVATIPTVGSRGTFLIFGGLLAVLGLWGGRRRWLILLGILALVSFIEARRAKDPSVLWEKESVYQHVRVRKSFDGALMMEVNEGRGMQSYRKPGQELTGYYWDTALIPPVLYPQGRSYLFLGVGGGTAPRLVSRSFPDMKLTGVEIDPVMIEAGQRYFEMDQVPMATIISDARLYLAESSQTYDFMMVDVYRDNRSIPFHLATREFFQLARSRLTSGGILLMNVSCAAGGERIFETIAATVGSVFPFTGYLKVGSGACEILASQRPLLGLFLPLPMEKGAMATDDRSNLEILSALSVR